MLCEFCGLTESSFEMSVPLKQDDNKWGWHAAPLCWDCIDRANNCIEETFIESVCI